MDFRGFDSSIILIITGGILMSIGDFQESLSRAILVGIILVGRFLRRAAESSKAYRVVKLYTYAYIYIYIYIYTHMYMHIYLCICIYIYIYIHITCVRCLLYIIYHTCIMYITQAPEDSSGIHKRVAVCMYVCIYIYIYMYTHTHSNSAMRRGYSITERPPPPQLTTKEGDP